MEYCKTCDRSYDPGDQTVDPGDRLVFLSIDRRSQIEGSWLHSIGSYLTGPESYMSTSVVGDSLIGWINAKGTD